MIQRYYCNDDRAYIEDRMEVDNKEGEWVKYDDHQAEVNAVVDNFEEIELWYVIGMAGLYFVEKMRAETACSLKFHDESPDARYARVFYRKFYREKV
jgi:hypothetical protein